MNADPAGEDQGVDEFDLDLAGRAGGAGLDRRLWVDPVVHAGEVVRFWVKVVRGPGPLDCWIWTGAIADDGYGLKRAVLHLVQHPAGRARQLRCRSVAGRWAGCGEPLGR